MRGQRHAPAALYPGKDMVPIVQEAGWASGPVWKGAENLTPPGFDPRTAQPVVCRCTDYITWPTGSKMCIECKCSEVGRMEENSNPEALNVKDYLRVGLNAVWFCFFRDVQIFGICAFFS